VSFGVSKKSKRTGTPKRRRRGATRGKPLHSQSGLQPDRRRGLFKTPSYLRTILLIVLCVIALAAVLYALSPRISVTSLAPLNPSDPFSTPLTILNDGYLTAHNVQAKCSIQDRDASGSETNSSSTADMKIENIGDLRSKEPTPLPCALIPASKAIPIASAYLTVEVSYRPDFYLWRVEKRFSFITATGSDGQLHWLLQPAGSGIKPSRTSYDRY